MTERMERLAPKPTSEMPRATSPRVLRRGRPAPQVVDLGGSGRVVPGTGSRSALAGSMRPPPADIGTSRIRRGVCPPAADQITSPREPKIRRAVRPPELPALPAERVGGEQVIRRRGVFGKLGGDGWKYSGGTMATRNVGPDEWHASVYVDDTAGRPGPGLFFDGFHLSNSAFEVGAQPHVFFSHAGVLDDEASRGHAQSREFLARQGQPALDAQILAAAGLAPGMLASLGPNLDDAQEQELVAKNAAERAATAEREKQIAAEAQARAAEATAEAEQSTDEEPHKRLFLDAVGYANAVGPLDKHLAGDHTTMPNLKPHAEWYAAHRAAGWTVRVDLGKRTAKPEAEARPDAKLTLRQRAAGKGSKRYTAEYRYAGYGTYRKDPGADVPPK